MPTQDTVKRIVAYASELEGVNVEILREGLELANLHRQVERSIENQFADSGLTARHVEILEALYHHAEHTLTPADLSDEVGLTRSAMTSALDSLEGHGYTLRNPHPEDRRMIAISLTPAGRTFIAKHLPDRYKKFHGVMCTLSENEREVLLAAYQKILAFLSREMTGERS